MTARRVLPILGGSPAVWTACVLFFQGALLAGYAYAHLVSVRLRPRAAVIVHIAVLAAGAALLPVGIGAAPVALLEAPVGWLLTALAAGVGGPFIAVAAGAPLLQRWLTRTPHRAGRDPYFLYAASNAGSLLGLLAYPLFVEPLTGLGTQEFAWSGLYIVYAALVVACGVMML